MIKTNDMESITPEKIESAIDKARKVHGRNFRYEVRIGTRVDLTKLSDNQKVCASDIKGTHILMTELNK